MFRSLFSNHENKPSNEVAFPRSEPEKKTFRRKLKSRLSSFRLSKRNKLLSTENLNMHCSYHQIASPDKEDDLNITTLSSILKTSNSTRSFSKKKLRFQDDDSNTIVKPTKIPEVSQTPESEMMSEEDLAYYKQLKEDLIKRSKELVKKSPLKRKYSTVSSTSDSQGNQEKFKRLDEKTYYYPPVEHCEEIFPSNDKSESVMIQHGICTYVWSFPPHEHILNDSNADKCLDKPFDHNETCEEKPNSDSVSILDFKADCLFSSEMLPDNTSSTDTYQRKITHAKKCNQYRYNPISKLEFCNVPLLSKGQDDVNKMSWCSA